MCKQLTKIKEVLGCLCHDRAGKHHFKYEKSQVDILSIASINPLPKHPGEERVEEKYFISTNIDGNIRLYQGTTLDMFKVRD